MAVTDKMDFGLGAVPPEALNAIITSVPQYVPPPPPPPEKRSFLGEVVNQGVAGLMVDLPQQIGKAMQYTGNPGDYLYEKGKGIADAAEERGKRPEYQPTHDDGITGAFGQGARMIAPSVGVPLAVGAGIAVLPEAIVPAGTAAIAGMASGVIPIGMAQGQQTYEAGLKQAGIKPEEATLPENTDKVGKIKQAGRINAAIEVGGELLSDVPLFKFMKILGGKKVVGKTAGEVLANIAKPEAVKTFGKDLLKTYGAEMSTEFGQQVGEAAIEKQYGIRPDAQPWQEGVSVLAPTAAMTTMLGLAGVPVHAVNARNHGKLLKSLTDPSVNADQRGAAAEAVAQQLQTVNPQAADIFRTNSLHAIDQSMPISLDDSFLKEGAINAAQTTSSEQGAEDRGGSTGVADQTGSGTVATGTTDTYGTGGVGGTADLTARLLNDSAPLSPGDVPSGTLASALAAGGIDTVSNPQQAELSQAIQHNRDLWQSGRRGLMQDVGISDAQFHTQLLGQFRKAQGATNGTENNLPAVQTGPAPVVEQPMGVPEVRGENTGRASDNQGFGGLTDSLTHMPQEADGQAMPNDQEASLTASIDQAAHEAAPSLLNDHPEPTAGQIEAGNYKKGHVRLHGLDISIENPAGSSRRGVDETGSEWETKLNHHYGYIKGTIGKDKDHVDVFIKPGVTEDHAGPIYVIDQQNLKSKGFDEHKVMLGFASKGEAALAYASNYDSNAADRIDAITETSTEQFKQWLNGGNTRKPFSGQIVGANNMVVKSKPTTGRRQLDTSKDNLLTAIAKLGGVNRAEIDQQMGSGKDLAHTLNMMATKGAGQLFHVIHTKGKPLDTMREALVEHGYLPADADINTLLNRLDDSMRGTVYHSTANSTAGEAAYDDAVRRLAEQYQELDRQEIADNLQAIDDEVEKLAEGTITKEVLDEALSFFDQFIEENSQEVATGEAQGVSESLAETVQTEVAGKDGGPTVVVAQPKPDQPTDSATIPATTESTNPSSRIADFVLRKLKARGKITYPALVQEAGRAFGSKLSEGKFSVKDVYDAMELGINRRIAENAMTMDGHGDLKQAQAAVADLQAMLDLLPTQTKRTAEMEEFQQFSTPPPLAYTAAWTANIGKADTVGEPSAGVGGLAVFAKNAGARVVVNELSPRRLELLKLQNYDKIFNENGEQINNILSKDIQPTVILMNPPFSSTAGRMQGERKTANGGAHIEQALKWLAPGGRVVAIVGEGMTDGRPAFRKWWDKIKGEYTVRANIGVEGGAFKKYGTTFGTQLLVIDKTGPTINKPITGQVATVADLLPHLEGIRNERQQTTVGRNQATERGADQSTGSEAAATGQGATVGTGVARPATGVVGTGQRDNLSSRAVGEPDNQPGAVTAGGRGVQPGATGGNGPAGRSKTAERSETGSQSGTGSTGQPLLGDSAELSVTTKQAEKATGKLTDSVYEQYKPQRLEIAGAKPHPTPLVQSAAMASVEPPAPTYTPKLPKSTITDGKLSLAQLESVVYAGQAHEQLLANGQRKGYFIGDGTGVGKGREISGIIMDNMAHGRTKAIWVSEKAALVNDAKRDFKGVGGDDKQIFDLSRTKVGNPVAADHGIMFTTYDTAKSGLELSGTDKVEVKKGKQSRLDQIVNWVGTDFDGVIAFDEAHNMANSIAMKGTRGMRKPSMSGLAGVELQKRLPNARIVYVSATGATNVENLGYAERLGLWGEGTPFPRKADFIGKITDGGVAAMELVARDMKAMGGYISRSLSYDDVAYNRIEHKLTQAQREVYDELAGAWQIVLNNIGKALEASSGDLCKDAKSSVYSKFWGAQQRFFNQIITAMQMPSVLEAVQQDLDNNRSAVLQLVNTNEAIQNRQIANMGEDSSLEELDMTPRENLMQYLQNAFPTQQYEEYTDENENVRSRPVLDANGNPVQNAEAVAMREALLDKLGGIRVPDGPLEILLNHFGTDKIAEVTGRNQRVVYKEIDGVRQKAIERRSRTIAEADADSFMNGEKRILVFSDAGGTGRSYHADLGHKNQQQRNHYLIQPGWRADKAVQGFGRSHRSNQAVAPIFTLVSTDLKGQKRFISSIARRLDQLGALTKGERKTGSQGLFTASDNLESVYAREALQRFFREAHRGDVPGIDFSEMLNKLGLTRVLDANTGTLNEDALPEIPQFLNRILSLDIAYQNKVFDAFHERLVENIDSAERQGRLDTGLENYRADKVKFIGEQTVYTQPGSGAETRHVELETSHKNHRITFEEAAASRKFLGFYRNERSGKVWAALDRGTDTDARGNVREVVKMIGQAGNQAQMTDKSDLESRWQKKWEKLDDDQARQLWDGQYAKTPEYRTEKLHLITGTILPIWDRLPSSGGSMRVYRVQTDDGRRYLGRVINEDAIGAVLRNLGVTVKAGTYKPAEVVGKIIEQGSVAELANSWRIKRSLVSGEYRLELSGDNLWKFDAELKKVGGYAERIQFQTRYFLPTGEAGVQAVESLTKSRPIVEVQTPAGNTRFSLAGSNPVGGVTKQAALDAIAPLRQSWRNAPNISVVQSIDNLPDNLKEEIHSIGAEGLVRGAFDEGKVYLVADNLRTVGEATEILMHETVGHYGIRGLVGNRLNIVLAQVAHAADKEMLQEIADRYGYDLTDHEDRLAATEEYLAHMAQNPDLHPTLLARAVAVVKNWLRAMGIDLKWTDADIQHLIASARGFVERGKRASVFDGSRFMVAAWHGSPHDFERFSTGNIGTGEGNQSYGYGMYFAGSKEVAEHYKNMLAKNQRSFDPELVDAKAGLRDALAEVDNLGFDTFGEALATLRQYPDSWTDMYEVTSDEATAINKFLQKYEQRIKETYGKLYNVELSPEEDEYLLWDKPLSEQSEKVKKILADAWLAHPEAHVKQLGMQIYHETAKEKGWEEGVVDNKAASDYLHSLGVRGIKYLDGSSRNSGYKVSRIWENENKPNAPQWRVTSQNGYNEIFKTESDAIVDAENRNANNLDYNYVIFNDADVEIKAKYSLAPDDAAIVRHAAKIDAPSKVVDMTQRAVDLAGSWLPPKLKAQIGKFLSNPWYGSEGKPLRRAIVMLNVARAHLRNSIIHDLFKTSDGYIGIEGIDNTLKTMTPEEKGQWNALIKQSDIDNEYYTDKELRMDISPIGKKLSDKVITAYRQFHQVIQAANRVRFAKLQEIALIPYAKQPWFPELTDLLEFRHSLDAGLDKIQVGHLNKLISSTKRWTDADLKSDANPIGKPIDKKVIAAYNKFQDRLAATSAPGLVRMAYKHITEYRGKIDEIRNEWGNLKGYAPRNRKDGDWHVSVYRTDDSGERVKVYMKPTMTEHGAQQEVARVTADLPKYLKSNYEKGVAYKVEYERNKATPSELMSERGSELAIESLLNEAFEKTGIWKTAAVDVAAMKRAVLEELTHSIMAQGFSRHGISREEHLIEGYDDQNYAATLKEYVSGLAGWLSKMQYAVEVTRDADTFAQGNPDDKVWIHKYYKDSMRINNYLDEIMGTARSIASVYYLGFKVSSAILNAMQNYVLGQAELHKMLKDGKRQGNATLMLARAQHDVLKDRLTAEEQDMLHRAVREGQAQAQAVQMMSGTKEMGYGTKWRSFTTMAMTPFQWVEQKINREPAILAAYRAFKTTKTGEFDATAFAWAEEFSYNTHFLMGRENLPELVRDLGSLGKTAYLFQGYTHNYLHWLYNRAKQGEFGVIARSFGALAALGGVFALPGADDLDKWLEKWFGKSYKLQFKQFLHNNTKQYGSLGEAIEGFINYGAPSVAGVDMSRALAVNIPFFSDPDRSFGERMGGVWSGIAQKPVLAAKSIGAGSYERAVENLLPEFIANPLRAYRQTQGATTMSGKPIFDEQGQQLRYTPGEAVEKMLGFQPKRMTERTQLKQTERDLTTYWNDERRDALARIRTAKDGATIGTIQREFNKRLKQSQAFGPVTLITLQSVRRARQPSKPNKKNMSFEQNYLSN